MPLRYVITKATAQGEQMTVEVAQCNPITGDTEHTKAELEEMVKEVIAITNDRMVEMNLALLEAKGLHEHFDPITWIKFKQMLEVLYGRLSADTLADRWYSEVEETAELERGRQEALQHHDAVHEMSRQADGRSVHATAVPR